MSSGPSTAQNSENPPSFLKDLMYRNEAPANDAEVLKKWFLENEAPATREQRVSTFGLWFAPSVWASQWPEKSARRLTLHRQSLWMAACSLCATQGPEWARVVQEPPHMIQVQPTDSTLGKRGIQPFLPTILDWDSCRNCRHTFRYWAGKGSESRKKDFVLVQELQAASVGNLEWLHQCLKTAKDINTDRRGYTALHLATEHGNLNCMMALVEQYNFPMDMLTNKGWTPLHLAINKENPSVSLKCIQYLLEKGASVNVQDRNGVSPLHLASSGGLLDCIKFLVKAGADVNALDNHNWKPIDYCKARNHRDCARFLRDAMWKQDKKEFAQEMGQLNQLKKRLLVMQNKYHLEKKKEREFKNQVAFTKWIQTKPLPKLPKVKRPESAPVTKKPSRVAKASAPVPKKSAPVPKLAPHAMKPQPPWRPQPPPKRCRSLSPPARGRFRPLKRTKPRNARTPLTILPSLSPLIPSQQSQASSGAPRSGSRLLHSPSPPSTAESRGSAPLRSFGEVSSSGRFPSASLPASSQDHSRPGLSASPPSVGSPGATSDSGQRAGTKGRSSSSPDHSQSEQPLFLLDIYLADVPLRPPPARPSSPSYWTARWNLSTNPAAPPATQIAFPQGVRLGVDPDRVLPPDFCDFLKFFPDGEGGLHIQTVQGQWIFPVPRLPASVLRRELCPRRLRSRLKVPEGLRRIAVQDLPRRRYAGDQSFWTDSMAMSLRDTFDSAFISLVRKHQGLPPRSPSSPSASSSSPSSLTLRQCWALLFSSLNNPSSIKPF